jgi:GT2 family glycosyltransferase
MLLISNMIKTRTAVVILNWNGENFLQQFLPTIIQRTNIEGVSIVVVDNGSTDNSVEILKNKFSEIHLIQFDKNYGFTGGYNKAFKHIDCEHFLLLNSDIEVTNNWLQPLISFLDNNPQCAACTPKLKAFHNREYFEYAGAAGGFLDKYGYPFCRGRIFDKIEKDNGQYNNDCQIFWGSGAALLVRSSVFRAVGGFDEMFFAHMEEIDLCWRMQNIGYTINYIAQSTVYHIGGGTLPQGNPKKTFLNFRNSLFLLFKNLPAYLIIPKIFSRMILDGIAALWALLKGNRSDFVAIFKAHISFYRYLPYYISWRKSNKAKRLIPVNVVYNKSIVYQHFAKKKTKFTDLYK